MKKLLQIINFILLLITIAVSYVSNTGIVNHNTMKSISDKYHNLFTPAPYAFSIWGLIYLSLLGFVIFTARDLFTKHHNDNEEVNKIGWWFAISCMGNSLWVIAWLYDQPGLSVILMIIILFSMIKIIKNLRMELDPHPFKKYLFIFWPFSLYSGWITVALIADIAAWLTKMDWNGWGISSEGWTLIMIAVASFINVWMVSKRNLREYGLVGIWGLCAIAISNKENMRNITNACYAASAIILLSIILNALKNLKGRTIQNM
ncbi:MAG: hypothetical protein ACTHK0_06805 [Ginsengibacter sp.]